MDEGNRGWSRLFGTLYGLLSRNPPSNRLVAEIADLRPGETVLDIGSGSGSALAAAAEKVGQANVAGADPTAALAERVRRRLPEARVEVAAAEDLPFEDHFFDVVWTISSYHHWEEPERGLIEAHRVLRPGGRFILAESRMRREGGHGLSGREAKTVITSLERIGFAETDHVERRAGRRTFHVILARKP